MATIDEKDQLEIEQAQRIFAETPRVDGIESISIRLGNDNTGDPAMWLDFKLAPGLKTDRQWIQAFSDYSTKLGLKILHSGVTRFPYTRLGPDV